MTGFGDAVDKFYEMIIPGKVYLISNASCKMSKRQFSNVNNEYEIHLEPNSVVQLDTSASNSSSESLPKVRYNFTAINQIASTEKDKFVDVLGVVREQGELQSLTAKATGKKLDKRDIQLLDMSNAQVRLTVWGQDALNWSTPIGQVVAIKGAKVGEYNGAKTLSSVSTTQIDTEPDLPEAHRLRGWYQSGRAASESITMVSNTSNNSNVNSAQLKTLSAVKSENLGRSSTADYFSCLATVQHIRSEDNKVWYEACPQEGCNKKVFNDQAGQYRCERCQRLYDHCDYRYILSCQIADQTDSQWVNVFGEQAEQLLGVTAAQLATIKNDDNAHFERIMKEPLHRPLLFRVRAKMESYQGEERVRLNVIGVSKVDPVKEGTRMISNLIL